MDAKLLRPGPWWDAGTLDPARHRNLVMQMESFIHACGLASTPQYLWEPTPVLPAGLNPWLDMAAARQAAPSLILSGPMGDRRDVMARVVGRCLREFTDARLRTFGEIVSLKFDDALPDDRVLLIPDFVEEGLTTFEPPIRRAAVLSHVFDRLSRNRVTVLGVSSFSKSVWPFDETAFGKITQWAKVVKL